MKFLKNNAQEFKPEYFSLGNEINDYFDWAGQKIMVFPELHIAVVFTGVITHLTTTI
jgi:hypothetical protein